MARLTKAEFEALTAAVCLAEAHWEDNAPTRRAKALDSAYEKIKHEYYEKTP